MTLTASASLSDHCMQTTLGVVKDVKFFMAVPKDTYPGKANIWTSNT